MGKWDYKGAISLSAGELPKEQRKVINKIVNKKLTSGFENTTICVDEISAMLQCFDKNAYNCSNCTSEIAVMQNCVDLHEHEMNPKDVAAKWQKVMKFKVLQRFIQQRVQGRLR
jgi:hypothetical protein